MEAIFPIQEIMPYLTKIFDFLLQVQLVVAKPTHL